MNVKKKDFYTNISTGDLWLIGAVRNEYGEIYCLYCSKNEDDKRIFITGDELDWDSNIEFNIPNGNPNDLWGYIKDFRLNEDEINRILMLAKYWK